MRTPIFVRPLSEAERQALEGGLRSAEAFVLRRCQIRLASAAGQRAPAIAQVVRGDDQTVREVIRAFNTKGLATLARSSSRPARIARAFATAPADQLRALLHHSPRAFGKASSRWTLALAAEVSVEQGLTAERVSGETVRATLARWQVNGSRAQHWITSPDPAYARTPALAGGAREKRRAIA